MAINFLLGNGILDAVVAVVGLIFVLGYLRKMPWSIALGLICVTASLCSGAFFVVGTVLSGAWGAHPLNYFGLVVVFSPLVPLFFILVSDLVREGRIETSRSALE